MDEQDAKRGLRGVRAQLIALLVSPQFWVAILTLLGTVVGYWIKHKIKKDQAAEATKARQDAEQKHADQEQVNWANETARVNDQARKQRETLDGWQNSSEQ